MVRMDTINLISDAMKSVEQTDELILKHKKENSAVSLIDGHIDNGMTDNEIIKVGDVCAYFYDNQNTSFSIVEVVKELSDECVVVKFHQVLRDDSGNDLFTYLCNSEKTMNVSKKYLHKLDLINRKNAEIEGLKRHNKEYSFCNLLGNVLVYSKNLEDYNDMRKGLKSEAIKEFAEKLKTKATGTFYEEHKYVDTEDIDNLVKERT